MRSVFQDARDWDARDTRVYRPYVERLEGLERTVFPTRSISEVDQEAMIAGKNGRSLLGGTIALPFSTKRRRQSPLIRG